MNKPLRLPIADRDEWLRWRRDDVTASVAACLFGDGVHPYTTAYDLWARKSGLIDEGGEETPAQRRGNLLEPVALALLAEERPDWKIEPGRFYYRDIDARIGATPDALATRPDIAELGVVQIKTVGHHAFHRGWKDEFGEVQTPLWIGVQATIEAALVDARWAAVAAMQIGDGGIDMHVEDVPLHAGIMEKLRIAVAEFWRRVEAKQPYPPDFRRDAAIIAKIYRDDDGGEIDLSDDARVADLIAARQELSDREAAGAAATKERKAIDAEIIAKLGNAARGRLGDGRVIEARTVRRAGYEVKPASYRAVKVKTK